MEKPVAIMKVVGDEESEPKIWNEYRSILQKHKYDNSSIEFMERFDFYDRTIQAYAIVATAESALYANIILKMGIVES